jgi:hypothetical protein
MAYSYEYPAHYVTVAPVISKLLTLAARRSLRTATRALGRELHRAPPHRLSLPSQPSSNKKKKEEMP